VAVPQHHTPQDESKSAPSELVMRRRWPMRGLRPLGQTDLSLRIQPGLVMQIEIRLFRRQ
jgi:hypothetical protein